MLVEQLVLCYHLENSSSSILIQGLKTQGNTEVSTANVTRRQQSLLIWGNTGICYCFGQA